MFVQDKVVLITGASSGIGLATAKLLSEKGMKVYGTSREATNHNGLPFDMLTLDVNNPDSIDKCISQIIDKEKKIDVLVNNAGFGMVGPIEDSSLEDVKKQFDTNFFGVHRMISKVLPMMKKQGSGLIVNMGSFGGRLAIPYQSLYSASKAALAMYTDGLRMETYSSKINVCLIEPGDTQTEFDKGRILVKNFDPEKNAIAKHSIEIMKNAEHNGALADGVAKKVFKAIKAKNPKPRYTNGIDAKLVGLLLRLLPYSVQEYFLMMNYKVPRKEHNS